MENVEARTGVWVEIEDSNLLSRRVRDEIPEKVLQGM